MKVGILSGTFDPIHKGHLAIAQTAVGKLELDEVWLVPERRSRRKTNVSEYDERVAMIKLSLPSDLPVTLHEVEDEYHDLDMIKRLNEDYPEKDFILIFGADVASHFRDWQHLAAVKKHAKLAIGTRKQAKATVEEAPDIVDFVFVVDSRYGSAAIRRGEQQDGLAPKVAEYIKQKGLYEQG